MKAAQRPSILQPEFHQAEALVTLRTAEEAMKSPEAADRAIEAAENQIRTTLSVTPTDSLMWLMMYSVETARNGFDAGNIVYLDQSYVSGPNDGWVALRRNRLALAALPMLSERTQSLVISEFTTIVDSDFIDEAALNLTTVGWVHRERLTASLEKADISSRQSLARRLSVDGVKLRIPGIETGDRPWR
ncbi:hypothetical protein [Bradyrhizobium sp. UNPA324]|uniref:hypothetical protein n=1 Tax=Bradyrhizobium sp. UNPA324 TaxID=1141174 RepID=UPI00115354F8|nr:hypothetical protein [Bradyrhizobium sp. UNPA324]